MTEKKEQLVADYFAVAGLPDNNPEPVNCVGFGENYNAQEPITGIEVINKESEEVPSRFAIVERTPSGHLADLNSGCFKTPDIYLCVEREKGKRMIADIVLLSSNQREINDASWITITKTPGGSDANVSNTKNELFIAYRYATEIPYNEYVVTDLGVILLNKGEKPPYGYFMIPYNLNTGKLCNDVYIIYKKSLYLPPLLMFKPVVITRYPQSNLSTYPFPNDVACFCLPKHASVECWQAKRELPPPKFSAFVLPVTKEVEHKVYGAVLAFYEPYSVTKLSQQQRTGLGLLTSDYETQQRKQFVYVSKCICLLSRFPFFDAFRTFLLHIYGMVNNGTHNVPVERYITHFLEKMQLPTPTRSVMLQLSPKDVVLPNFRNHPLPTSSASFVQVLSNLGAEMCLRILLLTLMEKKIVICSADSLLTTAVVEAMSMMIFPLRWHYLCMSSCPLDTAAAVLLGPSPCLVGIDTEYFDKFDCPSDAACVDLNAKQITGSKRGIQKWNLLPKAPANRLQQNLSKLRKDNSDVFKCTFESSQEMKIKQRNLDAQIQEEFLRFMAEILKDYRSYIGIETCQENEEHDTYVVHESQEYIQSKNQSCRDFYKRLTVTKQFCNFIDNYSINDLPEEGKFFHDCIDKLNKVTCPETAQLLQIRKDEKTVVIPLPVPVGQLVPIAAKEARYSYNGIFQLQPELFFVAAESNTEGRTNNNVSSSSLSLVQTQEVSWSKFDPLTCDDASFSVKSWLRYFDENKDINLDTEEMCKPSESGTTASGDVPAEHANSSVKKECDDEEIAKSEPTQAVAEAKISLDKANKWAIQLLSTSYSLWFTLLSSYIADETTVKSTSLRLVFNMLVQMRKHCKGEKLEKDTYDNLLRLCDKYAKPRFTLNVLLEMKRCEVQSSPTIERVFQRGKCQLRWRKLCTLRQAIAKFWLAGKQRQQRRQNNRDNYPGETPIAWYNYRGSPITEEVRQLPIEDCDEDQIDAFPSNSFTTMVKDTIDDIRKATVERRQPNENDQTARNWINTSEAQLKELLSMVLLEPHEAIPELANRVVSCEVGHSHPLVAEIQITSCSQCKWCSGWLFDDEIMAGWVPEDDNDKIRCYHCKKWTVTYLKVDLTDYRHCSLPCKNAGICREPILVPYKSPLLLKKELKFLEQDSEFGLQVKLDAAFVDEFPIGYWNLVYIFQRSCWPNYLMKLLPKAHTVLPKISDSTVTSSLLTGEKQQDIRVKIIWDHEKFRKECGVPLYSLWLNERERRKKGSHQTFRVDPDVPKLVNKLIASIRKNKLSQVFPELLEYYEKIKNIDRPRHFPAYRDLMYLYMTVAPTRISRNTRREDLQNLPMTYRAVYNQYQHHQEYLNKIGNADKPPNDRAISCQMAFYSNI